MVFTCREEVHQAVERPWGGEEQIFTLLRVVQNAWLVAGGNLAMITWAYYLLTFADGIYVVLLLQPGGQRP